MSALVWRLCDRKTARGYCNVSIGVVAVQQRKTSRGQCNVESVKCQHWCGGCATEKDC